MPGLGGAEGGATLQQLILAFGSNLISYLPLDETSGATAADASGNSRTGTYANVTLNSIALPAKVGGNAPLFNGGVTDTSYINWYTASLAAATPGAAGTFSALAKTSAWADGVARDIAYLRVDSSNYINVIKSTTNNELSFQYRAGGSLKIVTSTALAGSTDWFLATITWSKAADEVKAFLNGVQVGTTQTGLGTWAGTLSTTLTNLGAHTQAGASVWAGGIAHPFLLNRVATPAEIAALWAAANP